MQTHTPQSPAPTATTDERVLLLEEVDFKWLMAGQGWWIDTARLHNDPAYAARWLELVESTGLLVPMARVATTGPVRAWRLGVFAVRRSKGGGE